MKRIFTILFFGLLLFGNSVNAQVFEGKGDLALNAGFTLGTYGYGYGFYGNAGFPIPLTVNVTYGIHDMFSVGPYLGYMQRGYGVPGDRINFTSVSFGAQGVFHATEFLNDNLDFSIDEEKVDFYGKLILGYEVHSWRYNGETYRNNLYNNNGGPVFGPVFGVRYMFNPNVGGYAEGGRGNFGWLTLGVNLKL